MRDISLYFFLRLLMLFSVLVSTVIYERSGSLRETTIINSYFLTFCTFALTTFFLVLYEKSVKARHFLVSQVAYDILFTTALIFFTESTDSVYSFFYFLNIIYAAILFEGRGALVSAFASGVSYLLVCFLLSSDANGLFGGEKTFSLLTTLTAFLAIALLSGQLVEELRKSRMQIRRLEALGEEIVESLDSGLLGLDTERVVRKVNRAALDMLGVREPRDLLGRPFWEILPKLGEDFHISGSGRLVELELRGRPTRLWVSWIALPDENSMVLLRDLSEILDLQERVQRQERLAAIGRLAAGVAHEIRNPIASISGSSQLLGSGAADDSERQRLLDIIVRESERVDRLVGQLLRYSRPVPLQRAEVDFTRLVQESWESVKTMPEFQKLEVEAPLDIDPSLSLRGSEDQLKEAVTNLLVNAMQALRDSGKKPPHKIAITAKEKDGFLELGVRDNGPGIPREFRGRIFDPFFSTKSYGTGLGLAQVHKIVREHEGQVDVETEEGKGTLLRIRIPV